MPQIKGKRQGRQIGTHSRGPYIYMERCFYHFWTQKGPPLEENIGAMKVPPTPICIFQTLCQIGLIEQIISPSSYYFQFFLHQSLIPLQTIRKIIRLNTSSEHLKNQEWKLC